MFDSYSRNSYNNPQTVDINAVSGTLVKNYKDSFILRFHMKSELAKKLLDKEPKLVRRIIKHGDYPREWEEKVIEPVVVLQLMLCGEQELLAEVMWKEDFDKMYEPQGSEEQE
jgi:hypothetical protein